MGSIVGVGVSGAASFGLHRLALPAACRASWELPKPWQGLSQGYSRPSPCCRRRDH